MRTWNEEPRGLLCVPAPLVHHGGCMGHAMSVRLSPIGAVGLQGEKGEADLLLLRPLTPGELRSAGKAMRGWFDPSVWGRADVATRALIARTLHLWIREEYGLPGRPLVFANDWAEDVWGDFQPETRHVRLTPRVLLQDDPTALLDTLAHENRHAVQYQLVEELESHRQLDREGQLRPEVDWVEVAWWRDATRRYRPYRSDHWKPYFYNPLEVDAREAGANLVDKGFWSADRARREAMAGG
jgi:hypothetical protein